MKLQLSTLENISAIMQIIQDAKQLLASLNIDQWQNGYPNEIQITNDVINNQSYVVVNDKQQIMATSMFTTNKEPTYKIIEGKWLVDEGDVYGVIHRMAIKKEYRNLGIAKFMFQQFHQKLKEHKIQSLKIDTHEENIGMQSLIKKMGYQYCGVIYTSYGDKRFAFEKLIHPAL